MKNLFGRRFLAAVMIAGVTGLASSAQAATLVGVFDKNDPFPGNITGTLADGTKFDSPALAKCDDVSGSQPSCGWKNGPKDGSNYSTAFTVTFDAFKGEGGDREVIGGSWSFDASKVTGANPVLYPAYMAVKAGSQYALYALDDSLSGLWSTGDLAVGKKGNQPGLSHLSFYDTVAPVPLPAAVWLLLGGVGMLGAASRRRRAA